MLIAERDSCDRCIDGDCEICGDLPSVMGQIEVRLPAACRGMPHLLESG